MRTSDAVTGGGALRFKFLWWCAAFRNLSVFGSFLGPTESEGTPEGDTASEEGILKKIKKAIFG